MPSSNAFDGIPRGLSVGHVGELTNNFFADPAALAGLERFRFDSKGNRDAKIFLGVLAGSLHEGKRRDNGQPEWYVTGGTPIGIADDRHVMTIAGSRAGKGRSALIPNLMLYPADGSSVVMDVKGELADETGPFRAKLPGHRVVALDPFGQTKKLPARHRKAFNPLRLLIDGERKLLTSNAALISEALVKPGDAKEPHWDNCSREMIAGLCLHVATYPGYKGCRDLVTVYELAAKLNAVDPNDDDKCQVEVEMESNPAAGGAISKAARSFYDRTGGERSSVVSTLRQHLNWISYEPAQESLRGDSIDLRDLQRKAVTVYVCVPALQMNNLAGWMRLVVQLSLAACETSGVRPKHPVLFMLDEFNVLGRLKSIEVGIAQIAGFGVKLWIVLQDLGQLKQYDNWQTFIGNTGVIQAFGNADEATLEYLSKQLGTSLVYNTSSSQKSYKDAIQSGASGESHSIASHPLLTPSEIARFFGREDRQVRQLVLCPGRRPMVMHRVFYDKHELFKHK